jgi:hypothetical protein
MIRFILENEARHFSKLLDETKFPPYDTVSLASGGAVWR